jgi:tetratricopeptide (TPR) repeat protein
MKRNIFILVIVASILIVFSTLNFASGTSDVKEDYIKAIETCKQAIRIDPNDAIAYNNLGNAYAGLGLYKEAIEAYKQAILIDPNYARLL